MKSAVWLVYSGVMILLSLVAPAQAHHVMGRPSYSLNEDSNTPPAMQVETRIGDYFVTCMVFPAFPRANEPGRINFYAVRVDTGAPYRGKVRFSVRDDGWFSSSPEEIGVQSVDDNVFRQGFVFQHDGDYVITASFEADGQPYSIDVPLRIGQPSRVGVVGMVVGLVLLLLLVVNVLQRHRISRDRVRDARKHTGARQ